MNMPYEEHNDEIAVSFQWNQKDMPVAVCAGTASSSMWREKKDTAIQILNPSQTS